MRLLMWEPVSFSFESFFGDKGFALWGKKTLSNKVGIYVLRADLCRTLDLAFGRTPQSPKDRPQCLLRPPSEGSATLVPPTRCPPL